MHLSGLTNILAKFPYNAFRYMLFFLVAVVIFIIIFILIAPSMLENLLTPKNPEKAKKLGDDLINAKDLTVLVVVAHPDDVDWYAGGTLHKLHKNDNKIIVVLGTSGEKGGNAKGFPEIREKEQKESGEVLGYDEIIFLRYPDRELKYDEELKKKITEIVEKYRPNTLFTFDIEEEGYFYHHSDHRAAGRVAIDVAKEFPEITGIYLFHSSLVNVIVDIGDVVGLKTEALDLHKSQSINTFRKYFSILPDSLFPSDAKEWRNTNPRIAKEAGLEYCEIFRKLGEQ